MAFKDGKASRRRLILLMASIILGVAAIVAIQSFGENLKQNIEDQSKSLLGADLVIDSNTPISENVQHLIDSIPGEKARERNFASMISFPKTDDSRLVQVRALEGNFPFYGEIVTTPANVSQNFQQGRKALVDATVMLQYDIVPGDLIKVGETTFEIAGSISEVPGQSGIAATVAPPVYIPLKYLEETGLLQKGSRIENLYYFKLPENISIEQFAEKIESRLDKEGVDVDTPESTGRSIGRSYENVGKFLNLVAFISLLLGCVGVASAVHVYIKEKLSSVAILRCVGATRIQTFWIFLIQIVGIGLGGALIGAIAGTFIQQAFPYLLQEFLPVALQLSVSWKAIFTGIGIGVVTAILFALLPLLSIWDVSPLRVLRVTEQEKSTSLLSKVVVFFLILAFIWLFSFWQLNEWEYATAFTGGVFITFGLLAALAALFMQMVRKFFPTSWSFVGRQSLLNLFRPQNQTLILIISIGIGTFLISTLYFTQDALLGGVAFQSSENDPNLIIFDIQTDQREGVAEVVTGEGLPILQEVPIVTMKLHSIRGKDVKEIQADTTEHIHDWILHREYRVTFRDSLKASESLTEGAWSGEVKNPGDSIFISLEEGIFEDMKAELGDELVFNVQGVLMPTYIGSVRKVEWNRLQTNFIVLFPEGVLEEAPQFHVLTTKAPSNEASAGLQQALVKKFPNVSIVDLKQVLITIEGILSKISWVISFMAFFSIVTGLIVLTGAIRTSKYQRIKESVLLRTLGAKQNKILAISALEYMYLGGLASFSGILLAFISSWLLAWFSFDTVFTPSLLPAILLFGGITLLSVIIGLSNSRSVIKSPPLEVLRKEV